MNKSLWKRLNMNELNMTQNYYVFCKCATALFDKMEFYALKQLEINTGILIEIACLTSK